MMKSIEQCLIVLFLAMVTLANISNGIRQLVTLVRVNQIVVEQREKLVKLQEKEKVLTDKVNYAQSDEYKQRLTRKLLGMGTEDDYWIILPKQHNFESVYPVIAKSSDNIPNWRAWYNLIVPTR